MDFNKIDECINAIDRVAFVLKANSRSLKNNPPASIKGSGLFVNTFEIWQNASMIMEELGVNPQQHAIDIYNQSKQKKSK
jgi:hypothetical protein